MSRYAAHSSANSITGHLKQPRVAGNVNDVGRPDNMRTINLATAPEKKEPRTRPAPRVMGDDLFAIERPITCVVCDAQTIVTRHTELCDGCAENLDASAGVVANRYAVRIFEYQRAWAALWQAVEGSSERAWWDRAWDYKCSSAFDATNYARAWEAAKQYGGERGRLCALWEALDSTADAMEVEAPRYVRASAELKAARDVAGWPVEVAS
jgi:hypothetical protein